MIDVLLRALIIGIAAVLLMALADRWQRRTPRSARTSLPEGISVVVTPACHLCDVLRRRLTDLGIVHTTVPAGDLRLGDLAVRTAPTLLCIGKEGEIQTMRVGRAALDDLAEVIGCEAQAARS